MQIFAEFCKVFGSNKVYNGTFPGGERNLWLTQSSLKWKQNPGDDNKHSKCLKVREKPMADTQTVILSKLMAYRYRRCNSFWSICLNYEILFVRWILHILIDEKKTAKHLLKTFPKFIQRYFANIVTGAETWVR